MEANWRPAQGSNPAGDWRVELRPEARGRSANMMMETLKYHLPVSTLEGLNELQRIAVRFEEKIYTEAADQSDYLEKISLKILSMEPGTQQAPGNAQLILNQINPGQASADSTAQTGRADAGDWQEEIYQMIKSLKHHYFAKLNELFSKISLKLQHDDSIILRQMPSEQYERMKSFKKMLDCMLQFMQISKSTVQPFMRCKVPQYEKYIISILNLQRRKPVQRQVHQQFHPPAGQAPNSSISQQKQPSQSLQQHDSHTSPQTSLSSVSTGLQSPYTAADFRHVPAPPTTNFSVYTQQNGGDIQRPAGFNTEAAQGSNFSSLQYGSVAGGIQRRSTLLMQGMVNAQLQTMSTTQPDANSMQANARGWEHLSGPRTHTLKRSWRDAF